MKIQQQIADTDIDEVMKIMPDGCEIKPYPYQCAVYRLTGEAIRRYKSPFYINASVSAGKSLMIAMISLRFQQLGMKGMVLSRQSEIIVQDADQLWELGVKNSIFSASAGMKSVVYPLICGTEKTVANAMCKELVDFVPDYIIIDENHMLSTDDILSDSPETQYSMIILEMQRRCKALNKRELRVIGYTGSPFRGTTPILGNFWKEQICDISTEYLVGLGFIVPTIFGTPARENMYHLEEFHSSEVDGVADFSSEQLKKMQDEILRQGTTTQKIMLEVMELTKNRNGVMITCSGVKHCHEAAKYLPEGTFAIITESTGAKKRKQILDDAYNGRIKYLLQVAALTTGINLPLIDTSVILRKIMSLTLLVQLLGRGMRKLKKSHIDSGHVKDEHLVLDYSDTMHELGALYHNPILEQAELARAKRDGELRICPECDTENSIHARRCISENDKNERCEYFFSSRDCPECATKNDPCARNCRSCDYLLIDPNDKLTNTHYTENDYINVDSFNIRPTKNGEGLLFEYGIHKDGKSELVREVFYPSSESMGARNAWKMKAVIPHVQDVKMRGSILRMKDVKALLGQKSLFLAPKRITHRVNDKGRDIIHRKDFVGDVN